MAAAGSRPSCEHSLSRSLAWERTSELPAPGWEGLATPSKLRYWPEGILRGKSFFLCPILYLLTDLRNQEPCLPSAVRSRASHQTSLFHLKTEIRILLTSSIPQPTPGFSRLREPRNREGRQKLKSQIRPDSFFSLCKMRTVVLSDTSEFGRGPNELTFALKSTGHTVSAICLLLFLLAS